MSDAQVGAVAASALLTACNGVQGNESSGGAGAFPSTPAWQIGADRYTPTDTTQIPSFPSTVLRPGETYHTTTVFVLGTS